MLTILSLITFIYLLTGIIYFGAKKQSYSHVKNTISELGEYGSNYAGMVNYRVFLPVGLLLFIIALLSISIAVLPGLSISLGIGYVVGAIFPCDPGSPLRGTGRQQIHNLGGIIEYGGGLAFIMHASVRGLPYFIIDFKIAGYALIACVILISFPNNPFRGLAQRVAEILLFISLVQLTFT